MRRALAFAVLACAACGNRPAAEPPPAPQKPHGPVVVAPVAADAPPAKLVGVLTAAESVDITPRITGVIAKVLVAAGDKVTQDEVVAEMDPIAIGEELRAAQAALAAASAGSRQAAVDVEDAQRKLTLETKSVEQGVSPAAAVEEARLGVKRALAALERARSAQAAEASRAQTAKDHLANTGLRAPFAGTVAMRYRDAGNRVEAGSPILRIVGHGKMRLRFAVPPERVSTFVTGAHVTAVVDTVAAPVGAVIKQVSPSVDPASGMILVEAELDDGHPNDLRAGLGAWVEK